MILGTLTSTFLILMKLRFLFFHQNCFVCLYYLFGGVFSSFSEQWDRWRRKFWGKTQKNYLFFWKKDFSALNMLSSSPRLCFVFFSDLNFELFELMFLVFFQMLPFILWMQKIKSHSLYIWKFIWNEILFFLWAHFWLWNNFFYKHFFFLHSHYS